MPCSWLAGLLYEAGTMQLRCCVYSRSAKEWLTWAYMWMLDLYTASLGRSAVPLTCRYELSDHKLEHTAQHKHGANFQARTLLLMDLCLN